MWLLWALERPLYFCIIKGFRFTFFVHNSTPALRHYLCIILGVIRLSHKWDHIFNIFYAVMSNMRVGGSNLGITIPLFMFSQPFSPQHKSTGGIGYQVLMIMTFIEIKECVEWNNNRRHILFITGFRNVFLCIAF